MEANLSLGRLGEIKNSNPSLASATAQMDVIQGATRTPRLTNTTKMSTHSPVKFFYLPNEGSENTLQAGPRRTFENLQARGRISRYEVCRFLLEAQRVGGYVQACRTILDRVQESQPDVLFWQHVDPFELDEAFVRQLRVVAPRTLLAYHEGDAFSSWRRRYSKSMRALIGGFDLVFQTSLGPMRELSAKAGAKRIYWVPSAFDKERFGGPAPTFLARQFDAVMIGTLMRSIPFLWEWPGARERPRLASRLSRMLGNRLRCSARVGKLRIAAERFLMPSNTR